MHRALSTISFHVALALAVAAGGWSAELACAADELGLQPGVRGLATRAPANMKIDGNLEEFRGAFCTPVGYFETDVKNRPAQFFYMSVVPSSRLRVERDVRC